MPIDGISVNHSTINPSTLFNQDGISLISGYDVLTGELFNSKKGAYNGLNFKIKENGSIENQVFKVSVDGSIHNYFNLGKGNYTDFTYSDVSGAIERYCNEFKVDPINEKLNSFEFGVNIELPFPVHQFMLDILSQKGKLPERKENRTSNYLQFNHENYGLKIYDKSLLYKLQNNLLRIEIKVKKMRYTEQNQLQIDTLNDLLKIDNYYKMGELLTQTYDSIIFDNRDIKLSELSTKDERLLSWGRDSRNWKPPDKREFTSVKEYNKARRSLSYKTGLFKNFGQSQMVNSVKSSIQSKWDYLINCPKTPQYI